MTEVRMREIIHSTPFGELKKNAGICVFYEEGQLSIGVSYEDNDAGGERYIYNIFAGEEYINICGELSSRNDACVDAIVPELVLRWNELKGASRM